MHRTLGNAAIKHDLLYISDFAGVLHCLDAKPTVPGKTVVYWTHDHFAAAWGTPLIVEDKVYVADEDGKVAIFALSKTKQLIAELNGDHSIQTTPVVANDTLYINTVNQLIALKSKPPADAALEKPRDKTAAAIAAELKSAVPTGWSSFRHDLAQTGVATSTQPDKLELLWEVPLGEQVIATAAILGEFIYAPCLPGELVCLKRQTGEKVWTYKSVEQVEKNSFAPGFKSSPTVTADAIYLGDEEGVFHAIDRATGKGRWKYTTGGEIYSSAAVIVGRILFGSYDNCLHCLDETSGKFLWKFETQGYVHCAPAVVDGMAFIAGCDEHLRGIDIKTGEQKMDLPLGSNLIASPAIFGDHLYVGTYGGEVVAVDWKKKEIAWRYAPGNGEFPFLSSAAVTEKLVIVGGHDRLVHAIDRGTGKKAWTFPTRAKVDSSPVVGGDRVFIGSNDGNFYELGLTDGQQRWKHNAGKPISAGPAIGEGVLVIASESRDGRVLCFGQKNSTATAASPTVPPKDKSETGQPGASSLATNANSPAIEKGDPQMLAWALVVDGTLADSVAKLGNQELPQQGAYRVIRLDATKARQALFDPAAKDHVYSELMPPKALRLSERIDDRQTLHWSPHFLIKPNVGHVTGQQVAEYLSLAGQPFDIQFGHVSFGLYAFDSRSPVNYQINQKSLSFRGDMPIGSAVAFIGKAESKTGKKDFHEVLVFEAVPKLNEQAEHLLRDVTWFKAGRTRERAALKQAEAYNAQAAKMPEELPAKWTKPLPHGGSVSLVAVARPATHPFCWWDPDGQPRATEWSLQQHAFGTGELIALVSIRDPNVTERERQGVSYMVTGRNPPLPLYRSWNETAPKEGRVDSELFLFSVYNTDDEQRPMIGINLGVGPWKELGKLPSKEEVTFGRADYILGGMDRTPDQSVYRTLGRRYLPDEDIRLRLIDKQGKSHPFQPSMFQSGVTDSRGVPAGWDGWSTFETQQFKEKDLDHVVLDSRSRHWMTFSGFATELAATKGDEPPTLTIAAPAAPASQTLSARLSNRFNAVLRAKYSDFFNDDDRAAIVEDLKRFTERHQPATLSAERASLIVSGLDNFLNDDFSYLGFFTTYRTLKWRLWKALIPRDLSPEELIRREQQREETRKRIRAIPITSFNIARTHGHTIDEVERLYQNPWHGWFHEPLSDKEVAELKNIQKNTTVTDLVFAARHLDSEMQQVCGSSIADNPLFGVGAVPLDAEVIANLKPGLLRHQTRYASVETFNGIRDLVFDEAPKPDRRILDWNKTYVDLPKTEPLGLEAVQKWAEENKTGLLAYESARHGLFMLRGAKLGLLPVETWQQADRLTDEDLFRIVGEQAKDSILLTEHYGLRPKDRGYGATPPGPMLVVESASGELGVVRVESISNSGITARLRVRPGAKRKVVAQAEVPAVTVGMTQSQVIAIKGKHYRVTFGMRAGQVIHVYDDMAVYYEGPAKDPKSSLIENPLNPTWKEALKEVAYADADTLAAKQKKESLTTPKRTIRVVDEQKQPIVGAKVRYQFQNDKTIFASLSMFTGLGTKAVTNKQGEFSEEIPEGADQVIITVTAEGFGEFSETQGASGSTVVTMKRGRVVHVRAVDGEGKILKQAVPLLNEHRVWGREFVQQKDGTFKSPSVSMKRTLMRVAATQDNGPMLFSELIDVSTAKPGEDGVLQLTLKPGTRIEGKLDDSVPRPVSEGYVELCLVEAENHTLGFDSWNWHDFTPVKPDGTFVFESVPSGGHAQIHVLMDGYISKKPTADSLKEYMLAHKLADEKVIVQQFEQFDYRAMRGLFVTLGQPVVTITVDCEKTASCDFLLLDPSGKPVPNVEVRFNPNGAFTFGRQFNPINLSYESLLVEELHKHQTATWNWNASLPHGREAKQQHDWMNKWIDRVKSDAEGRVRVRNLPGRSRQSFHVEAEDYALPVSPLLNDKDIAKRKLDDDRDRYSVVELTPGETVEKTIYLERKQPVVDREFAVIDSKGKPIENVELSVAEMRVGAKEWQSWSTQRFGTLPKGSTDKAGRVVLRIPSQIGKTPVERLRMGINYEFQDGLWLSRQVVEVPFVPDDGVISLLPNPEAGRVGRAVYGKLDDLLAKSSPKEWLDVMIKGPNLAVLRKLLASSKIKHPDPVVLLDDGRRGDDEKGSKVKVVSTGDTKFAIVLARVRPMGGALASESDPSRLPECAFVFDMEGTFIAALGGKLGTTGSNSPEKVDVICLGPEEDWFVRVHKFEHNGPFEKQTEYHRIANPVIPAVRYFHYANSNAWSNGPEQITRWGTLYFDFPSLNDKFDSPNHSDDGGPAQSADGIPVIRKLTWDGDRNRFVGAAAQFGKGKGLYEVDLNWSKEFEAVAPKANQLFITGGEREYDHWHSWQTVVPDKHELLLTIKIPQAEGEPKVIEKKLASGKRHIQVQLKPNKDNTSARMELRLDSEKPEVSELAIQLGDRPEKHPPITHLVNPGDTARVLTRPLKAPAGSCTGDLKLLAP